MARKVQVFAVLRVDEFATGDDALAVTEILPTQPEAEAEVARLNDLNRTKRCHYFWLATRFYPEGRAGTDAPRD
jgi:hypothetical protein